VSTTLERPLSASSDLWGSQEPRFCSVPSADATLGPQAVQFAAEAGLFLDPWQQMVLKGTMGLVPGGKWAARNVGLLVPRQNGKGSVLEARELFGMFALNEPLIIHSAHRFDTSQEHFLRMRNLIEANPDLDRHIANVYTANGKESITLKNGCRLKFKARTISGSGRGFSSDLLILDEAMILPEQAVAAMRPTMITRKNPQTWYTSSAGTPESTALWRLVQRGRDKAKRLAYFEWGCALGVDVEDRSEWAAANPGLGHRLPLSELEDEFDNLTPEDFAREHLGIWDEQADNPLALAWGALVEPNPIDGPPMYALEVAEDRKWSCVAAAGDCPSGTYVEYGAYQKGTGWVLPWFKELASRRRVRVVVQPSSPAGSLIADLEEAQIEVIKASTQDYAQACGDFFDGVVDRGDVRHGGQEALDIAVGSAVTKRSADAWVWDRRNPKTDISPLAAVTLAAWGHRVHALTVPNIW
jgi:phage terminase large subunit-like protein